MNWWTGEKLSIGFLLHVSGDRLLWRQSTFWKKNITCSINREMGGWTINWWTGAIFRLGFPIVSLLEDIMMLVYFPESGQYLHHHYLLVHQFFVNLHFIIRSNSGVLLFLNCVPSFVCYDCFSIVLQWKHENLLSEKQPKFTETTTPLGFSASNQLEELV